jgi:ABC-2 type transport system permease protein
MAVAEYHATPEPTRRDRLAHQLRALRVIAGVEFKLKYAGSAMGYVWSVIKPLSYFGVLWVVFGQLFKTGVGVDRFPLYLLIGIVLYTFFLDATGLAFPSLVKGSTILRRLKFPALVIPVSVTVTAAITLGVNLIAVVVFVAASHVTPTAEWFVLVPLLLELYAFVLGLGLILATLFVRLRDISQIWELVGQLLVFATPIMYPITILPEWAQKVAYLNPLVQVMQDVRAVMIGTQHPADTIAGVYGTSLALLLPIGITVALLVGGLLLFRRESPRFAERV